MTTPAIPAEEREINLLLALRNTAEGLTAAEIIKRVSGYNPAGGGSARRMFERDKDILRQIGVPLRASGTGDQCRYRIEEEDYALAPLRLDAAQTAALDLAASAWRDGSLPVAARRALTKLRAVSPGSEAGRRPTSAWTWPARRCPRDWRPPSTNGAWSPSITPRLARARCAGGWSSPTPCA